MPDVCDDTETVDIPARPLPRAMHSPPSSRRRSAVAPRRISSAPDLRTPSTSDLPSLAESSSTESLPFSGVTHFSDSPELHTGDTQDMGTFVPFVTARARPSRSATDLPSTREPLPQQSPTLDSTTRTLEEVHRVIRELQRRERRSGASGIWVTVRAFFGYGPDGSVARRDKTGLISKLLFYVSQVGVTIAILCIAAQRRSPTNNAVNEWQACHRPLGVFCAIWCVRVFLACLMAYWGYQRKIRRSATEAPRGTRSIGVATDGASSHLSDDVVDALPTRTGRRSPHPHVAEAEASLRASAIVYTRLTTVLSLLSFAWFLTAHVLIYTSIHTCRMSSPHLWWLTFGIICIGYLIVVEIILVAFIVFILGPLIFLFLNLILICMGRHPIRRHMNHINPDVGKMSPKAVELIPLVLYIPAPKESTPKGGVSQDSSTSQSSDTPAEPPLPAVPEAAHVHSYPPTTERPVVFPSTEPENNTPRRSRRLFTFRRIRPRNPIKGGGEKPKEKQSEDPGYLYEDKWERGDYPFVKLEDNRAACAVCLCDFEAPRRVRYSVGSRPAEDVDRAEKGMAQSPTKSQSGGGLKLSDPGEGAQPLRLLACAHVFHKSCLDPWLIEVSGRCPVCQRAVEVEEPAKPEGRRRRTRDPVRDTRTMR